MADYTITFVRADGSDGLEYGAFEADSPVKAMISLLNEGPWMVCEAINTYRVDWGDETTTFTVDTRLKRALLDEHGEKVAG